MILFIFIWLLVFALLLWLYDYLKPWYQYHKFKKSQHEIFQIRKMEHREKLRFYGYNEDQIETEMKKWEKEHA
jgi:hypothetical protein